MSLSTLHNSCYNYITRLVSGNIYASIQNTKYALLSLVEFVETVPLHRPRCALTCSTFIPHCSASAEPQHPLMAPKLSFLAIWGPFGAPIGPPDQRKGSIALPRVCPVKVRDVYCSNITQKPIETIRTYSRSQIEVGEKVIPDLLNKRIVRRRGGALSSGR